MHHRTVWGHLQRLRRPAAPEPVRSPLRLSLREREEISRGLAARRVAAGRSRDGWVGRRRRSSREVARNGGRASLSGVRGGSSCAASSCGARRRRSWRRVARLRAVVEAKLELRWSPQQISGWLVDEFPDDPEMRVSHETIYLSLFVQSRGALRKELTRYLRSGHTTRRPRGHTVMNGQGQLRGTLNIRERPAEAERPGRARPLGRRPAHGQTHARDGDAGRTQDPLRDADRACRTVTPPTSSPTRSPPRSPSCPNSSADRSPGTKAKRWPRTPGSPSTTGVPVYFCDPRSPWQRGSNENTNGLLRQYFPKRTEIAHYTQADLDAVAAELNGRPRQTLGWRSPSQALDEALR